MGYGVWEGISNLRKGIRKGIKKGIRIGIGRRIMERIRRTKGKVRLLRRPAVGGVDP